MKLDIKFDPPFMFLVLVQLSVLVCIVVGLAGVFSSTLTSVLFGYVEAAVWISAMMLMVFLFMHTRYYHGITADPPQKFAILLAVLMFGGQAMLGFLSGRIDHLLVFRFSVIIVLVSALCGGLRVALPSIACCVLVMALFLGSFDQGDWMMVQLMVAAAIFGSLVRHPGCPEWFIWAVPVILTFDYCLTADVMVLDFATASEESFPAMLMYGAIILVGCYYAIVLLRMFEGLIGEKEVNARNDRDLQVAHDIQMSSVPSSFPVSRSLDIYGRMVSAVEVGGDFYDSFLISRNLTAFIVADVSDKGLPASMLMMRMMGSFKVTAMLSNDPGVIMTAVNKELCRNNPADQFLTAWFGVYDSDTGVLQYANAGHTPPYIRRSNGEFRQLDVKKGLVVGYSDAVRYKTSQTVLFDGDSVFVYTDGVNEAFDSKGEQFGKDRLVTVLNRRVRSTPKDSVEDVFDSLKTFTSGCPASDDVTMLAFSVHRPDYIMGMFEGKVENLGAVNGLIEDYLTRAGCPAKQILKIQIVSEEIFVNICDHAYAEKDGDVTVYCRYLEDEIKLTFSDDAEYFSPIKEEDIAIDEDVGNWPIGGFGIHMVRNLVTHMDYKYFAGKNIFTVWKKVDVHDPPRAHMIDDAVWSKGE